MVGCVSSGLPSGDLFFVWSLFIPWRFLVGATDAAGSSEQNRCRNLPMCFVN